MYIEAVLKYKMDTYKKLIINNKVILLNIPPNGIFFLLCTSIKPKILDTSSMPKNISSLKKKLKIQISLQSPASILALLSLIRIEFKMIKINAATTAEPKLTHKLIPGK